MDSDSSTKWKVFIVRPWHVETASLYPFTMDGVEYIEAAIFAAMNAFPQEEFDVRVDRDVFVPGLTLRANVDREITQADLVLVFLDGLRANVIYELGLAYGCQGLANENPEVPNIVCLVEKNATVLVRNYYPNPFQIETASGDLVKILNPKLNISSAFSDNSDILTQQYDRLNLFASLTIPLTRLAARIRASESKSALVLAGVDEQSSEPLQPKIDVASETKEASSIEKTQTAALAPPASKQFHNNPAWGEYKSGKYADVVHSVGTPKDDEEKMLLGLSLMKIGRINDALNVWRDLNQSVQYHATSFFHMAVCYYALGQLEVAGFYFREAIAAGYSGRSETYLERIRAKLKLSTLQPREE